MAKRETQKVVELGGRKWQIRMMDAETGSWVALKLASKLAGIIMSAMDGGLQDPLVIGISAAQALGTLGRNEIGELQREALSVVSELITLNGKEEPLAVRMNNGAWGVDGLDDDLPLVMTLVTHSLLFTVSPFFAGDKLKAYAKSFEGLSLSSLGG